MNVQASMRPRAAIVCCDLCGGKDFQGELGVGDWMLVRCGSCSLVFTSPRYTDDAIAQLYSESYYQCTPDYFRSQRAPPSDDDRAVARRAASLLARTGRWRSLDVGCGAGRLVEAFAAQGFDASGLEPNAMAMRLGREAGRSIWAGSISEVEGSSRDCLSAMHVLEHSPSPRDFLGHCQRILIEGGLLVLEVPDYGSRAARTLRERWTPLYPDTHLFQFTRETIRSYLAETGFQVLSFERRGGSAGMNPEESSSATPSGPATSGAARARSRFRTWLWERRGAMFRLPLARQAARYIAWEILGHGEFMRVWARRMSG